MFGIGRGPFVLAAVFGDLVSLNPTHYGHTVPTVASNPYASLYTNSFLWILPDTGTPRGERTYRSGRRRSGLSADARLASFDWLSRLGGCRLLAAVGPAVAAGDGGCSPRPAHPASGLSAEGARRPDGVCSAARRRRATQ